MNITRREALDVIARVRAEPRKFLFGIDHAIENLVLALFTLVPYDGDKKKQLGQAHMLFMDLPGVGKSGLLRAIASAIGARSAFVIGEPTMETRELVGGEIYNSKLGRFFQFQGPIFANIFHLDEINRTHPKALAPLLQAMEERKAVLSRTDIDGGEMVKQSHSLFPVSGNPDKLFFWLLATANPLEEGGEGVFPIPEAIIDRFSFSCRIGYPTRDAEKTIRYRNMKERTIEEVATLDEVLQVAEFIIDSVDISPSADEYIARLIENSRPTDRDERRERNYGTRELIGYVNDNVSVGISPRVDLHFEAGTRTAAFFAGRESATIDDVKRVAHMIMDHRIVRTHPARGANISGSTIVSRILTDTEAPV